MTGQKQQLPPKGYRPSILWAVAGIVVLASVWPTYWWLHGRFYQSTDDAYVRGNVTRIAPRVSGYITRVCVRDNSYVHAGDPLVKLDPAYLNAHLSETRARVEAAQAAVDRLQAQYSLFQADIAQAGAELRVRQAAWTYAKQQANRYKQLARTQAGSVQSSEAAVSQQAQSKARFRASEATLEAHRRQLTVVKAQLREAKAALFEAQAKSAMAMLDVSYTIIRAPVDGYVGNRSANVGTFVSAGTQLMSLVPARGLWVEANFKEDQVAHMSRGQPVSITADVNSNLRIMGHVDSLSPATGAVFSIIPAQNATGNFTKIVQRVPVRIVLDGPFDRVGILRPGLSVTAIVNTRTRGQRS